MKKLIILLSLGMLSMSFAAEGNCNAMTRKCTDVFKSVISSTGNGIVSIENGVDISNNGNPLETATSACKPTNSFGICQGGASNETTGEAAMCLNKPWVKPVEAHDTNYNVAHRPFTAIAGKTYTFDVARNDWHGAWYLNANSRVTLRGSTDPNNPSQLHANVMHLNVGSHLTIRGHVVLNLSHFGFNPWTSARKTQINIPVGSSLEIRSENDVRISQDATINVGGKLTIYAQKRAIFEKGARINIEPNEGVMQVFATDIYAGVRYPEKLDPLPSENGAVYFNWDDVYLIPTTNSISRCSSGPLCQSASARAFGMYAKNYIMVEKGSKIRGIVYSASSQQRETPDINSSVNYQGTAYCSVEAQKQCIKDYWPRLAEECKTRVDTRYNELMSQFKQKTEEYWDKYEQCHKNEPYKYDLSSSCETNIAVWKPKCRIPCRRKAGINHDDGLAIAGAIKRQVFRELGVPNGDLSLAKTTALTRVAQREEGIGYGVTAHQCKLANSNKVKSICIQSKRHASGNLVSPTDGLATTYPPAVPLDPDKCRVKLLCNESNVTGDCVSDINKRDYKNDLRYGVQLKGVQIDGAVTSKYVMAQMGSNLTYNRDAVVNSRAEELCVPNQPPELDQSRNISVYCNVRNQVQIKAVDPDCNTSVSSCNVHFSRSGTLPNGITISSGGLLSIPANFPVGTRCFYVAMTDDDNATQRQQICATKQEDGITAVGNIGTQMGTRIAQEAFDVNISNVCLRHIDSVDSITFDLELLDPKQISFALNGRNKKIFKDITLTKQQGFARTARVLIGKSSKEMRFRMTNIRLNGDLDEGTVHVSDRFAIRPNSIKLTKVDPVRKKVDSKEFFLTAEEYKLSLEADKPGGYNGEAKVALNPRTGSQFTSSAFSASPQPVSFASNSEPVLTISYDNVGEFDLNVSDSTWAQVDVAQKQCRVGETNNNCSTLGSMCGCDVSLIEPAVFIARKLEVTNARIINERGTGFSFFGDRFNYPVIQFTISARDSKNKLIPNYANDINFTIETKTGRLDNIVRSQATSSYRLISDNALIPASERAVFNAPRTINSSQMVLGTAESNNSFGFERNSTSVLEPLFIGNTDIAITDIIDITTGVKYPIDGTAGETAVSNTSFKGLIYGRINPQDASSRTANVVANIYYEGFSTRRSTINAITTDNVSSRTSSRWWVVDYTQDTTNGLQAGDITTTGNGSVASIGQRTIRGRNVATVRINRTALAPQRMRFRINLGNDRMRHLFYHPYITTQNAFFNINFATTGGVNNNNIAGNRNKGTTRSINRTGE